MQTRGLAGFYHLDDLQMIYQNNNAEPEKLGVTLLEETKAYTMPRLMKGHLEDISERLERVSENTLVNERRDLVQHIRRRLPNEMQNPDATDIYELFQPFQGTLQPYLEKTLTSFPDATDFIRDSKFCQWAYVLNLENTSFDILRGNQIEEPQSLPYNLGEVSAEHCYGNELYYPCQLVKSYPLGNLPGKDTFLADLAISKE